MDMFQNWLELEEVVKELILNDDADALVWQYEKSGVYCSKSFYAIISFRGVTPV